MMYSLVADICAKVRHHTLFIFTITLRIYIREYHFVFKKEHLNHAYFMLKSSFVNIYTPTALPTMNTSATTVFIALRILCGIPLFIM